MSDLTFKAAHRHLFDQRLNAAGVVKAANQLAAGRFQAVSFKEGCLKVTVDSYDQVASLMLEQTNLLDQINQQLKQAVVTKLRIGIGNVAKEDH